MSNSVGSAAARVGRRPLGPLLWLWMSVLAVLNLWIAFRIYVDIKDSIDHATFFGLNGGINWSTDSTIPLVTLAGCEAVALVGLLLLFLKLVGGLWLFVAAQVVAFGYLAANQALSPATLVGIGGTALLVSLAWPRRDAFR